MAARGVASSRQTAPYFPIEGKPKKLISKTRIFDRQHPKIERTFGKLIERGKSISAKCDARTVQACHLYRSYRHLPAAINDS